MNDNLIVLGPSYQLHVGVHGSLLEQPPPGIRFLQRRAQTHFSFALGTSASPCNQLNLGEQVSFEALPDPYTPAHLSRTCYAGAGPWVIDADCLLGTLQFGRFFPLGSIDQIRAGVIDTKLLLRRQRAVAEQLGAPRCRAILLRTERARQRFIQHLQELYGDSAFAEALAAKTRVITPALPYLPANKNGANSAPIHILYAGRTFHDKGGAVAIAVLGALRRRYGERLQASFVGECPAAFQPACAAAGIHRLDTTSRAAFRELLAQSDIFLSPTRFESFGMGLLEAAAAGAIVVTAQGNGMEHVPELFQAGEHAILISNDLPLTQRIAEYTQAIAALIDQPEQAARLRGNCAALLQNGRLSLQARDKALTPIYADMLDTAERLRNTATPPQNTRAEPDLHYLNWPEELCYWESARHTGPQALRIRV